MGRVDTWEGGSWMMEWGRLAQFFWRFLQKIQKERLRERETRKI